MCRILILLGSLFSVVKLRSRLRLLILVFAVCYLISRKMPFCQIQMDDHVLHNFFATI